MERPLPLSHPTFRVPLPTARVIEDNGWVNTGTWPPSEARRYVRFTLRVVLSVICDTCLI